LIQAADESGTTLTVGLDSRFFWCYRFVKQAIEAGLLGEIQSFELRKGSIFAWPVASGYMFDRQHAGGGILIDIGPHVLDLLIWWLGDYERVEYRDDAMGGVEANCEIELALKSGVSGLIELSRDRELPNLWILRGDRATLEIDTGRGSPPPVHLYMDDQETILSGHATHNYVPDSRHHAPYERQLADFCEAIRDHREPLVGREGKKSIELIEACYASRQPIRYPWAFGGSPATDGPIPDAMPELEAVR
jgi:predicted dehydrogenase